MGPEKSSCARFMDWRDWLSDGPPLSTTPDSGAPLLVLFQVAASRFEAHGSLPRLCKSVSPRGTRVPHRLAERHASCRTIILVTALRPSPPASFGEMKFSTIRFLILCTYGRKNVHVAQLGRNMATPNKSIYAFSAGKA